MRTSEDNFFEVKKWELYPQRLELSSSIITVSTMLIVAMEMSLTLLQQNRILRTKITDHDNQTFSMIDNVAVIDSNWNGGGVSNVLDGFVGI